MKQVTAVITTYNRAAELGSSIRKLLQQTRVPDDIWVIDDASTDDTESMMRRDFPLVRYLKLPRNMGVIRARNVALANVCTDYLLLLDDDSWFVDQAGLAQSMRFAEANPEEAIIALNVRTLDGHRNFSFPDLPHPVRTFQGCAVIFNMALLSQHKLVFEGAFDRQGEEKDLALRAFNFGLSVCAVPDIEVLHAVSDVSRNWSKIRFYEHRNDVLRELLRCPVSLLVPRLVRTWASHTVYNLRHGRWWTDLKVFAALPWLLFQTNRLRSPVSVTAYTSWLNLGSRPRENTRSSPVEERI